MAVFSRSGDEPSKAQLRNVSAEISSEFTDELKVTDSDTITWSKNPGQIKANVVALPSSVISTVSGSNRLLDHNKHSDTTASVPVAGALVYANSTPEWDDLTPPTSVGQILTANSSLLPVWGSPIIGNPEGPPWGSAIRHYAYLKFPQTTTSTMNWGGSVPDYSWTRDSAAGTLTNPPAKAYVYAMQSTTTGTTSGFRMTVGGANGYIRFNGRPVVHYRFFVRDSAGTDTTKYKMYASMNNSPNNAAADYAYGTAIAMGCTTGNNTITSLGTNLPGFVLACWDKGAQANIQACTSTEVVGAGNGTLVCVDTGIAAPSSEVEIDIVLDFLDSSNAKVWVNGTATTLSSSLPGANSRIVQKAIGMRTTAATTGIEFALMNAEEWGD